MVEYKNIRLKLIFIFFFMTASGYSQEFTGAFIDIGDYPRSIALGQSVVALSGSSDGILINPASSGNSQGNSFSGMYSDQFGMAELISLQFLSSINEKWQIGGSFLHFSVDNIFERPDLRSIYDLQSRRDSVRALTEAGFSSFSDMESLFLINISRNFTKTIDMGWWSTPFNMKIPLGANFKVLRKELYNLSAYGVGLDLGGQIIFDLNDVINTTNLGRLSLGTSFTNIPETQVYWDSGKNDRIAFQFIYGLGYEQLIIPQYINVLALYQNSPEKGESFGLELELFEKIRVRAGSSTDLVQGGIGLKQNIRNLNVSLDYSFLPHQLGNSHRIGASIQF